MKHHRRQTSAAQVLQSQIEHRWCWQSWRTQTLIQEWAGRTWQTQKRHRQKRRGCLPVSERFVAMLSPMEMSYQVHRPHRSQPRRVYLSRTERQRLVWTTGRMPAVQSLWPRPRKASKTVRRQGLWTLREAGRRGWMTLLRRERQRLAWLADQTAQHCPAAMAGQMRRPESWIQMEMLQTWGQKVWKERQMSLLQAC